MTSTADTPPVLLRSAGTSLVLDTSGDGLPAVLHWGRDLGDLDDGQLRAVVLSSTPAVPQSSFDVAVGVPLLPLQRDGWSGTPGFAGHRGGRHAFPRWRRTGLERADEDGAQVLLTHAVDEGSGLTLRLRLALDPHGVVVVSAAVTNTGADGYEVTSLLPLLPLPGVAQEVLDLTGRWCRERSPQRSPLHHGTHLRAHRRGRPGHDSPLLVMAGTPGFGFRSGEVWGTHVAWSGDQVHLVERLMEGAGASAGVLGAGENLLPGEGRLAPGETHTSPDVLFVHSADGMDGLSARLHARMRARPQHPRRPRPVVLNTWEAVYFDHDLGTLRALADVAARVGVERFVLDDGWFGKRRSDEAGLGDWYVSADVWPQGLHPLFDHVRSLGMQVGLWVEPEMVNRDSDLVRAHPDWVLTPEALPWRRQQVLDLAHPQAHAHILERLDALVGEYRIDYLKWDHNRDLHVAEHRTGDALVAGVHSQTTALYALLDELRRRHPALEIESCASGGARVDLGILQRTDRVWASDNNDALERQQIQRWTELLVPPEMIGSHVGPPETHTTHRRLSLGFRCATALFDHAGIEWDLTTCSEEELQLLTRWTALHKELRPLLHSGDVVRADEVDEGALLHGVVAADRSEAVFAYVRLVTGPDALPGRVRLPGLDPDRRYEVRVRRELGEPSTLQKAAPPWTGRPPTLPGRVLAGVGLPMPVLNPGAALLLHLTS